MLTSAWLQKFGNHAGPDTGGRWNIRESPQLLQFILRGSWMCAPTFQRNSSKGCWAISVQNHKSQPHGGVRGKIRRVQKSDSSSGEHERLDKISWQFMSWFKIFQPELTVHPQWHHPLVHRLPFWSVEFGCHHLVLVWGGAWLSPNLL